MGIPAFDVGDRVRFGNPSGTNEDGTDREAFTDIDGAAQDPTTVELRLLKPDATELSYAWPIQGSADGLLTRESLGRFYQDLTLDMSGTWSWELRGTGAVETSEMGKIYVRWSPFT